MSEEPMLDLTLRTSQVVALATFCLVVAVMGLIGNSLVVYSSLRYNAIQLDRISILLVRNLAVADILYTLVTVIPLTITYCVRRYVLGDIYCFISAHLAFVPGSVNSLTVLAITGYRLRVVLLPLRGVSRSSAHLVILLIWAFSTAGSAVSLGYQSKFVFAPNNARCLSTIYVNQAAAPLFGAVFILQTVVPIVLITAFNIAILFVASRQKRRHRPNAAANMKGYLTVVFLSGLFICSLTPFVVFTYLKTNGIAVPSSLDLMAFHCIFLNVGGNPVLYTITNRRFGTYVKDLARRIAFCGMGHSSRSNMPTSHSNSKGCASSATVETITANTSFTGGITFKNPINKDTEL